MKLQLLIFSSCLTALFASCQPSTNSTLEEFKKVDSSLQKSNSLSNGNTYLTLYENIQDKKNKNPQLAFKADTLFEATEDALKFIDTLKQKLTDLDPSGAKIDIGSKLLMNNENSVRLTNKLRTVYFSCTSSMVDNEERIHADNIFSIEKEIKTNKDWTSTYFDRTPTVAVITILNKFKNDCSNLAVFSLTEIKNRLVD